jgi:DNA-directed RNA polymerase subunit RPC12/RpoP
MKVTGYKCNGCKGGFEDVMSTNPDEKVEVKCPVCGSTDVEQSDTVSEFLELVRDMGSTGG